MRSTLGIAQTQIIKKTEQSDLFDEKERLSFVKDLSIQNRFFHSQLEFIEVFLERGGFDVIVGNPPWVNITMDDAGIISEVDPSVLIRKLSSSQISKISKSIISDNPHLRGLYITESLITESTKEFLGSFQNYNLLEGQRNNLYKCIIQTSFQKISLTGYIGLIYPVGIYEDPKGHRMRELLYKHLIYHFHFKNHLLLFSEVLHTRTYSINIFKGFSSEISFTNISNLLHPKTIDQINNLTDDNSYGLKRFDPISNKWEWDTRGNSNRLIHFDKEMLLSLSNIFEDEGVEIGPILPKVHSKGMVRVLLKLSEQNEKISEITEFITDGFNEVISVNNDVIKKVPTEILDENQVKIISGPHFYVNNPFYKNPFKDCKTPKHYECIRLEFDHSNKVIRTNFDIGEEFNSFINQNPNFKSWLTSFKIVMSKMVDPGTERTLQSCIIPSNSIHTNGCISITTNRIKDLVYIQGLFSSLPFDFYIKSTGKTNIYGSTIRNIPYPKTSGKTLNEVLIRVLILNCGSRNYSTMWENVINEEMFQIHSCFYEMPELGENWNNNSFLKNYRDRRFCQIEIDVLVSMILDFNYSDLIEIYLNQFPTLLKHESDTWYDKNGKVVFTNNSLGLKGLGVKRNIWNEIKNSKSDFEIKLTDSELYSDSKEIYSVPFSVYDRVEDYKVAWAHFEKIFNQN